MPYRNGGPYAVRPQKKQTKACSLGTRAGLVSLMYLPSFPISPGYVSTTPENNDRRKEELRHDELTGDGVATAREKELDNVGSGTTPRSFFVDKLRTT